MRWIPAWLNTNSVRPSALGVPSPPLLAVGATAVVLALVAYALLLARNLVGARGMPAVVAHGWVAVVSLAVVLATAAALALPYLGIVWLDRSAALALHVAFAAYGFMGMLSLGLSYILVPMFALANAPDDRRAIASCALAAVALVFAGVAAFDVVPRVLRLVALASAAAAVSVHYALMRKALREGMRRELGRSFTLVRLAWVLLAASLVAAFLVTIDAPIDGIATLFGVVLIAGWLLTFLLGVLQRIGPFLASMHAPPGQRRPPTPSTLTDDRPLAVHHACHAVALAGLAVAILVGSPSIAAASAGVGALGAVAYAAFFATIGLRMARHLRATPRPVA